MLDYIEKMTAGENVTVEDGVLQLVVRAGGGSARDTLSVLDQLIAGSENNTVTYDRAVLLLGYTHSALLDEAVDALAARDSAAAFAAADRVIQTGQDPRRFVEDLLERLRDLIIVAATGPQASAVLRGIPQDEIDRMMAQARAMSSAQLSHAADVVNAALSEMSGATSPRLHLELMIARLLVESGASTKLATAEPVTTPKPVAAPVVDAEPVFAGEVTTAVVKEHWPAIMSHIEKAKRAAWMIVTTAEVREFTDGVMTLVFARESDAAAFRPQPGVPGGVHEITRQAIQTVLGVSPKFRLSVEGTRTQPVDAPLPDTEVIPISAPPAVATIDPEADGWATVQIPGSKPKPTFADDSEAASSSDTESATAGESDGAADEAPAAEDSKPTPVVDESRYGESVVREVLGATFLSEEKLARGSEQADESPTDSQLLDSEG
jgi:DNA polymerase-3 subunit gamma/tau